MYYNGFDVNDVSSHLIDSIQEDIDLSTPEEQEDLEIVKYTALGMWENYPKDKFQNISPEVAFRVKIGYGIYLNGRVDGIVQQDNLTWIRELKTTALAFPQFERRSLISPQATGYMLGLYMLNTHASGVMYDYIKKPLLRKRQTEDVHGFGQRIRQDYKDRPDFYYKRHYVYRQLDSLNEYQKDAVEIAKNIRSRTRTGRFPRNYDACHANFGECPYAKICHQKKPDPLTLQLYYKEREEV